ncbi:cysteinyl-tRNA synthetase, partial [Lecanoromycetidae sp. Uapishka_2]
MATTATDLSRRTQPPWHKPEQSPDIIIRGRQRHLLEEFKNGKLFLRNTGAQISNINSAALAFYLEKNLPEIPKGLGPAELADVVPKKYAAILRKSVSANEEEKPTEKEGKTIMHIKTVLGASRALTAVEAKLEANPEDFGNLEDVLMPYLDRLYLDEKFGPLVDPADHTMFTKVTKEYEKRFTEDMRNLNVLDPDDITRVTEYGPQIVDFVKQIEAKGFTYNIDGSVYFDTKAFEAAGNNYARLEPWNSKNLELVADGEGASSGKPTKRSDADFALWKISKPGEPSWPSPWGLGRPGWHIECSAMASDKLGSQIDIHSGGIDLAFPHHDNELAQSEAYWLDKDHGHQHQWVNYFLHMGHLSIAKMKMSKSLKNFTTIRQALEGGTWTSRGLRIFFLKGGWHEGIELGDQLVQESSAWEEKLNNFFIKAKDVANGADSGSSSHDHHSLADSFTKAKTKVSESLCDSFDTPTAMKTIADLISTYSKTDNPPPSITLDIARWTTSMVNIFGLNGTAKPDDHSIGWSGIDVPAEAMPILTSISNKRDTLRRKAIAKDIAKEDLTIVPYPEQELTEERRKIEAPFKALLNQFNHDLAISKDSKVLATDILKLSDRIRDVDLFNLDVYLEDKDGDQPALIRPVTRDLRAARQEKAQRELEKQRAKEEREKKAAEKAAQKAEEAKVSPLEMFRTQEYLDEFGVWDEKGIPVKDKKMENVAKNKRKKFEKEWERQKKDNDAWLKANESVS